MLSSQLTMLFLCCCVLPPTDMHFIEMSLMSVEPKSIDYLVEVKTDVEGGTSSAISFQLHNEDVKNIAYTGLMQFDEEHCLADCELILQSNQINRFGYTDVMFFYGITHIAIKNEAAEKDMPGRDWDWVHIKVCEWNKTNDQCTTTPMGQWRVFSNINGNPLEPVTLDSEGEAQVPDFALSTPCIMAEWMEWGDCKTEGCELNGTRFRERERIAIAPGGNKNEECEKRQFEKCVGAGCPSTTTTLTTNQDNKNGGSNGGENNNSDKNGETKDEENEYDGWSVAWNELKKDLTELFPTVMIASCTVLIVLSKSMVIVAMQIWSNKGCP